MKAFVLDAYSRQARPRLTDRSDPRPGPRDVPVRIHAAGLNQLDGKIRDGAFKPILPHKPPLILGHDLAGVVEADAIHPVIDRPFPFDQINEAFAYLDTGRAKGKVVVTLHPGT